MIVDVNSKGLSGMKKHLFRSGFNLIEVTMAIAIVGIGIAGVMALFPPAIEANKAANNQNYIGLVTDSFLGYLEGQYLRNFTNMKKIPAYWAGTEPSSAKNKERHEGRWEYTKEKLASDPASVIIPAFPGLYKTDQSDNKYVFALESADGTVNALIVMWRTAGSAPDTDSNCRRVYVEVSWPAALPYANRTKKLYVYDVFNE